MEYKIEYVSHNPRKSIFKVNDYEVCFRTKSEKEILKYLDEAEAILKNKKSFESLDDLWTDTFKAFEFFALTQPEIVKEYFVHFGEIAQNKFLKLGTSKFLNKRTVLGVSCNVPIEDDMCTTKNKKLDSTYNMFIREMFSTSKIVNEIYGIRQRQKLIESKIFKTSIGNLVFCGYETPFFRWELNGCLQGIFKKKDNLSLEQMAERIVQKLEYINFRIKNKFVTELLDFCDFNEIKIFDLYIKCFKGEVRDYIELFYINKYKRREMAALVGHTNAFYPIDIFFAISTNKDSSCVRNAFGNHDNDNLKDIVFSLTKQYIIKQTNDYITNDFKLSDDNWVYYYVKNSKLKRKEFEFGKLKSCLIKYEFKQYMMYLLNKESQTKNTLRVDKSLSYVLTDYILTREAIDYFVIEHSVCCFADITEELVECFLKDLEHNLLMGRIIKSLGRISACISAIRSFSKWIYKNANKIKTTQPQRDVFLRTEFSGTNIIKMNAEGSSIIPEYVIQQIQENLHHLKPPAYKRLLICLLNSPRRFNEFQHLLNSNISPIIKDGVHIHDKHGYPLYMMEFSERKKQKNKEINIYGMNYKKYQKRIPINYIAVKAIEEQILETKLIEEKINNGMMDKSINIEHVFIFEDNSMELGYSLFDTGCFVNSINVFLKNQNICDENGELWNFGSKQTRKTGANILVDKGYNLDVIQKQLGHERSSTTYNSYIELSHMRMAQENTKFIKAEFDDLFKEGKDKFSEHELTALFTKFCIDWNKIYYNRKLLGVCGLEINKKCPNRDTLENTDISNEFPCADCPNLYVGKQCRSGWEQILQQAEENISVLKSFFEANNIPQEKYIKLKEYKVAYIKYYKAQRVIDSLTN